MRLSSLPFGPILLRATCYFLVACLGVTAIIWPGYSGYLDSRRERHVADHVAHLDLMVQQLGQESYQAGVIVKLLSNFPLSLQALTPGPGQQQAIADLAGQFSRFAHSFPMFSQLRVIDSTGQEIVRVNHSQGNVINVPRENLQNKADRDYFRITSQLNGYEIYVSAIDLNQENGKLEDPLNPTQRFATPVLNGQGQFVGMVVGNLDVKAMLDRARWHVMDSDVASIEFSILNRHGYWITANNPDLAWGWQRGHPEHNLAHINPKFWALLNAQDHAVIEAENGVYVSASAYPMRLFDQANILAVSNASSEDGIAPTRKNDAIEWKTLLYVPDSTWLSGTLLHERWVQGAAVLLTLFLAFASWLLARQHAWRRLVRDLEQRHTQALADLYENAPCCYQSVNTDGMLVRMNQTGLDWLGYQRHEVINRLHYSQVLQPDPNHSNDTDSRSHLDRIKQEGELQDHPMLMRRKDGSLFPVSLSSKALKDENGNFLMTRTTIADMTERYRLEEKLREQAFTDELTGAINRRQFSFLSEHILGQMPRTQETCVLMVLDIDHFKRINDTYGHAVGDTALKAFVRVCKENIRANDLLARMGGEEFAVLLPETDLGTGIAAAERIRSAIEALRLDLPGQQPLSFTVSIGLGIITPDNLDLSQALSCADERLYRAKTNGRNRVVAHG